MCSLQYAASHSLQLPSILHCHSELSASSYNILQLSLYVYMCVSLSKPSLQFFFSTSATVINICMWLMPLFIAYDQIYSATHARLEAAHVDEKAKIKALQRVEVTLKAQIADLEKEKAALLSSRESASTEHSGRVQALTQELERVAKEKEELCLQYAREIECAQTQLSVREQELVEQRHQAMQETRQQLEQEIERLKVGSTQLGLQIW